MPFEKGHKLTYAHYPHQGFQKGHPNFCKNPHTGPTGKRKTHCIRGHERTPENLYGSNGRRHTCKICHRMKGYEWNENKRFSALGITRDEWQKLFEKQKGCCAICIRHQSTLKKKLVVDHNHESGRIRGLLCHACNLVLGNAREDASILQRCIQYLKTHEDQSL